MEATQSPDLATRLALSFDEAAAALHVSRDHFDRHIRPHLRLVQQGRVKRVSVGELRRWVDENEA
ncbi:unannotated protein [freshwater metagenome]|uniref:Unannotated protein n=1 Tax=freshwater metagenome TaxID=449393 RepID=A0A6J7FS61_9ZZZZ|nr:hypothetical protein [Actinomycetota bacterium]